MTHGEIKIKREKWCELPLDRRFKRVPYYLMVTDLIYKTGGVVRYQGLVGEYYVIKYDRRVA